jgi:hypothetical protein
MSALPSVSSARPHGGFWPRVAWWAPLVVPVVYVVVIVAAQPDDHLGPPDWAPELDHKLYDDFDPIVMVQHALSARLGQVAGLPTYPEACWEEFAAELDSDRPPDPQYCLEYPHAAVYVFRLDLLQPSPPRIPAVVADRCFINLLHYRPESERDRELWRYLRRAIRIHYLVMLACFLGLVAVLRSGYEPGGGLSSNCLLMALPSAVFFSINRFDIVPALLTALSLWCLGRRRFAASAVFLALGAAVKVYPVLLSPLFVRYLWAERRAAVVWTLTFAAALGGLLAWPLLQFGWEAFAAPYRFQLSRVCTMAVTIYHSLLPESLSETTPVARGFRLGSVVVTIGLMVLPRMPDLAALLRRSAVVLIVFQCVQNFFSPQFYLWLLPLLLPLTARHRGLVWMVVGLDLLTFMGFAGAPTEWMYGQVPRVRFLLFGAVIVMLIVGRWTARPLHEPEASATETVPVADASGSSE